MCRRFWKRAASCCTVRRRPHNHALEPSHQPSVAVCRRGALLQVGTVDIVELPDGYAFHVDPVSIIAQHLEEFAVLERLCCPFLTIAVRTAMAGAQPVVEIGGGNAVKEFIAAEFGIRKLPTP